MDFLAGKIRQHPMKVSWKGNSSFDSEEVFQRLFTNKTDFIYYEFEPKSGGWIIKNHVSTKEAILLPNFKCSKIEAKDSYFGFESKDGMYLHLSDSKLQPSYRLVKTGLFGDIINVGNIKNFDPEEVLFDVKVMVVKKRSDKTKCKEYSQEESYINCVEKAVRKELVDLLGCLPPWMTKIDNEDICDEEIVLDDEKHATKVKSILDTFINQIYTAAKVDLESSCAEPCTQIHFNIKKVKHNSYLTNQGVHWLSVKIEDEVDVMTEQSNYTIFNLIVEVGSSLGLWVGLSALGIFDHIFYFVIMACQKGQKC